MLHFFLKGDFLMRSKTILAAVVASAFAVPFAASADSDSYKASAPSTGASVDSNTSVQGSLGSSDRSASTSGQERNDRYAQNDDHDNGRHRGRDKHGDKDKDRDDSASRSSSQYGSSSNGQYAQNDKSSQYPSQSSSSSSSQYPQGNQSYSSNSKY